MGVAPLNAPFKGGVLVPDPNLFVSFSVDQDGGLLIPAIWPAGVPAGLSIYLQHGVQDPGGPAGFAARLTTPSAAAQIAYQYSLTAFCKSPQ